jgi:hypothetical protein
MPDIRARRDAAAVKAIRDPFADACDACDGRAPSSSLDPLETFAQTLLEQTAEQRRLHGPTSQDREKIIVALATDPEEAFAKRCVRLSDCCRFPAIAIRDDGQPALLTTRCRERICPFCAGCRSREVSDRITAAAKACASLRFLTLTQKSRDETLSESLDRIADAFRRFRRTVEWRAHVAGGVFVFEVKRNQKSRTWHAHIHLLIDGSFWAQNSISAAWKRCTGDSFVVDVRAVHDRDKSVRYVAKYAGKPAQLRDLSREEIREYADAIRGRRLFGTFGTLHAHRIDAQTDEERSPLHSTVVSVRKLLAAIEAQNASIAAAARVLAAQRGRWQLLLFGHNRPTRLPEPDAHALAEACETIRAHFADVADEREISDNADPPRIEPAPDDPVLFNVAARANAQRCA